MGFEKEVLPILQKHCLKCHGAEEKVKGELNLTNRKAILDGERVDKCRSQESANSLFLKAIHYKDDNHRMPPRANSRTRT